MQPDSDLLKYQIPHDPRATHQLHWNQGQWGKGLVDRDGLVHTWPTSDLADGDPSHVRYRNEIGVSHGPHIFWISPDGEVEDVSGNPSSLRKYLEIDPRLRVAEAPGWGF